MIDLNQRACTETLHRILQESRTGEEKVYIQVKEERLS